MDSTRLIDLTESDLRRLIATEVRDALRDAQPAQARKIVSGRKNIAAALGISTDKLDAMIAAGDLDGAVRKNGRTLICDIAKAFDAFADPYNQPRNKVRL